MRNFKQGYYKPKHPEKYVGDLAKIRYMSSYELHMHEFLDNNTRVLRWSSEPFHIPYIKPTDGKLHRYFPDYWVEYITQHGELMQEVLEIKPFSQTHRPKRTHKHSLYEQVTYAVNQAKWKACTVWCDKHGMKFRILTEKSIFK